MDLATVFTKGDIAHMMQLIFNCPVTTPEQLNLFKGDHTAGQTGHGETDMRGAFTALEFSSLTSATQNLRDPGPLQVIIERRRAL